MTFKKTALRAVFLPYHLLHPIDQDRGGWPQLSGTAVKLFSLSIKHVAWRVKKAMPTLPIN